MVCVSAIVYLYEVEHFNHDHKRRKKKKKKIYINTFGVGQIRKSGFNSDKKVE